MIVFAVASMECDEQGCKTTQIGRLVLTVSGGFAFRPNATSGPKWHVGAAPNGVFVSHCPEHARRVTSAPVIPDLEGGRNGGH